MRILLSALAILISVSAQAQDRTSSYYGQLGLGGSTFSFDNDGAKSNYRGWGYDLEGGIDLSGSKDFGLNVAGLAQFSDLTNKNSGERFAENGEYTSLGAKAGIFFGPITVGVGMRKTKLAIHELSVNNGYVKTELTGEEKFGFLNMTFNINKKYRSTAEVTYSTGTMGDLKAIQMNLFFRVGIVDSFGR